MYSLAKLCLLPTTSAKDRSSSGRHYSQLIQYEIFSAIIQALRKLNKQCIIFIMLAKKTQKNIKYFVIYWLPFLIWAVVIFSFSSKQVPSASEFFWKDFIVKKTAHIIEYAIMTALLYRGFLSAHIDRKKAGYYSIIFALVYGMTDEFHQLFTPGRTAKLRDVIIDTLGGTLSIYFIWYLLPKCPKRVIIFLRKFEIF